MHRRPERIAYRLPIYSSILECYRHYSVCTDNLRNTVCYNYLHHITPGEKGLETEMRGKFRKAFYPLESNPDVFNDLMYEMGVSKKLAFVDVYSLEDDLV